jgi:CheY-like chemotaxis protein
MIGIKPDISASTVPSSAAIRILLVEDNVDNQFLFCAFVKKLSCQIEVAENGAIGVEKFKSGSYDLVLMDMQMPVMDGYTATQIIRQWENEKGKEQTPVIALTANSLQEMAEKSLAAGCTAHVTKPVPKDTFIGIIWEYGGRRRS